MEGAYSNMKLIIGNRQSGTGNWFLVSYLSKREGYFKTVDREQGIGNREPGSSDLFLILVCNTNVLLAILCNHFTFYIGVSGRVVSDFS